MDAVDWALLGRAVEFYKANGYTYVEAPWAVESRYTNITCPNPQFAGVIEGLGVMVGSAEQSFLALDLTGQLPKGRFVACTPCVRLGDVEDGWHFPYFMKVELYDNTCKPTAFSEMMMHADQCFMQLGAPFEALDTEETNQGLDITINGIEVGSYGVRQYKDLTWHYGTGLALPRFSQALKATR